MLCSPTIYIIVGFSGYPASELQADTRDLLLSHIGMCPQLALEGALRYIVTESMLYIVTISPRLMCISQQLMSLPVFSPFFVTSILL